MTAATKQMVGDEDDLTTGEDLILFIHIQAL